MSKNNEQFSQGFTLVEMAIVMIIIGLLIGGILKGQELIVNAQVAMTASQYKGFLAAEATFVDNYNALPGDIPDGLAQTRIPNCNAANFCTGGNGDSQLGTPVTALGTPISDAENILYWKHLSLADLITGVNPSADSDPAGSIGGYSHPVANISGTWNAFAPDTSLIGINSIGGNRMGRIYFEISARPNTHEVITASHLAARLDRKLDDGMPNLGAVTAEFSSENCDEGDNATSLYNETTNGLCVMFFRN